ncbi:MULTISPECIES: ABC transporter permease [unclassified Mesorhizobium]|uniref:ABC transporter permease n=1 Tax=unclassified Mesorhizobium TaxID=325217 RepID=UPI0003CF55EA|nr:MULTISPECIES: ABC transporter permease [unclassified Mesorhizobium]ESW79341.1 ABC transporter permease [Mesorhizobium sp. LSJC285A00]ESZ45705.1 ABC transporter permease [Mesorhizobium sp. L103C565B0]ESZ72258.1 ABC transporter permease [Mesorhizobium sp. L103C119B0]
MSTLTRIGRTFRRTAIQAVPTVLGIVILNFFLLQLAPGDAADVMAGEAGSATVETMAALRERFGLDNPLLVQLFNYLYNLAHFSLGFSPRYGMPVADLIGQRLPGTLLLMAVALSIAIALGLVLGSLMAVFSGRLPDRLLSVVSLLFYSIPGFWIGLMLIVLFSVKLGWLPSGGSGTIGSNLTGLAGLWDKVRYMILPALSLALFYVAIYARLTRAAMLEVQSQDYVRTAAAKGLSPTIITIRHVLRNALIPITTMAGMHVGGMLGGAVVVETVYSWPGLGRLAFEAVMGRDFTVLLGILLLSSLLVIVANATVDLLHAWLDPRIGVR